MSGSQIKEKSRMFKKLLLALMLLSLNAFAGDKNTLDFSTQIKALEQKNGGKIGVAALNTVNNQRLNYRADERFAMCSTFKMLLVASVLAHVDAGNESLGRILVYTASDILEHAPITKKYLQDGKMSIADLSAATIQYSDNTAANLLFQIVGGPEGLTNYIRSLGDKVTRFDRIEPNLNTNIANDEKDTTTPSAMISITHKLLIEDALSPISKKQLISWLVGNTTGDTKLRAGMPLEWKVGDKTGSGENGASNDVAIVWPTDSKPFLIAVYYTGSSISTEEKNAVIAEVGRIVSAAFRG